MERKTFEAVAFKADDGTGAFRATIATLAPAVDSDGDVTLPGAFPDGKSVAVSAFGHGSWSGDLPVGKGVIGSDARHAWVSGKFFLDTSAGVDTYRVVKALGALQEWSFGYEPLKISTDPVELAEYGPDARRILQAIEVYEVSPVLKGAGVNTRTDAIKSRTPVFDLPGRTPDQLALEREKLKFDQTVSRLEDLDAKNYLEVDAGQVPYRKRALVDRVLAIVCPELGLRKSAITVLWFLPEEAHPAAAKAKAYRERYGTIDDAGFRSTPINGKAERGVIWLCALLDGADLVETTAHECRHLYSGFSKRSPVTEYLAHAFGLKVRNRFDQFGIH